MKSDALAAWEGRLRPLLTRLPPSLAIRLYSRGRGRFLAAFARQLDFSAFTPEGLERTLWGIVFRSPLLNAAGMFKLGEGYEVAARQGAGAYLAGTTTERPRTGNRRNGVAAPFVPYPRSGAASNWLGLPNPGHRAVAERLRSVRRVAGCPLGASVTACPEADVSAEEKLAQLVAAMELYDRAGVDFLEMNESCPNTGEPATPLRSRLAYVADRFLARRVRRLPVIVKFSCDTAPAQVPELVAWLVELGYDGVNFGNTSTAYARHRPQIAPAEQRLFDAFTRTFGGGVSGRPLKADSLRLVQAATTALRERPPAQPRDQEFHVVRTGGVESAADVRAAEAAGASLCQWYSGYFEAFAHDGHALYQRLYGELQDG